MLQLLHQWRSRRYLPKIHGIVTCIIKHPEYSTFRLTPSVFSTLESIGRCRNAIENAMRCLMTSLQLCGLLDRTMCIDPVGVDSRPE